MSHCYLSIHSCGELGKGTQTGEFFSVSDSEQQQQQPQHNDATNAGDDKFDFASIFTDDPAGSPQSPASPPPPPRRLGMSLRGQTWV